MTMAPSTNPDGTTGRKNNKGRRGKSGYAAGNKKISKKKKCPFGSDCKYQHEYQHQLEFHHNETETDLSAKQNVFKVFSGRGQRIDSTLSTSSTTSGVTQARLISGNSNTVGRKKNDGVARKGSSSLENSLNYSGTSVSASTQPRNQVLRDIPENTSSDNRTKRQRGWDEVQDKEGTDHMHEVVTGKMTKFEGTTSQSGDNVVNLDKTLGPTGGTKQNPKRSAINEKRKKNLTQGKGDKAFAAPGTFDAAIDLCDTDDEVVVTEQSQILKVHSNPGSKPSASFKRKRNAYANSVNNMNNVIDITKSPPSTRQNIPAEKRAHLKQQYQSKDICNVDDTNSFIPGLADDQMKQMQQNQKQIEKMMLLQRLRQEEARQIAHAVAQSNRDVTNEQDAEYYESLRRDREKEQQRLGVKADRLTEEEMAKRKIAEEEDQKAEEARIGEDHGRILFQHSKDSLEEEPPVSDTSAVTIAFKLPRLCTPSRIIRRFRSSARAEQLHFFLNCHATEELKGVKQWELCQVVGHERIAPSCTKSMLELGLYPRGLLIVKEIENEEEIV